MSVAEGRKGNVTVVATTTGSHVVAEMGEWNISGETLNMIPLSKFQDTVIRKRPGMLNPGTITFSGYFDGTDSSGQLYLFEHFSSGVLIDNSSTRTLSKLRLWANDDTTLDNYGFWSCTGSSGRLYITQRTMGQNSDGVGTLSFTAEVSDGLLGWSTST